MTTTSRGRTIRIGVGIMVAAVLLMVAVFEKSAIITALRPGETLALEFPRNYKIEEYASVVKIAGTQVGVVSDVSEGDDPAEPTVISVKLDPGTRALLGTEPTAEIRPTTVLGGKYYISLAPGGSRGTYAAAAIPRERTRTPVELNVVLAAIPPDAQRGLQGATERLDAALQAGAGDALGDLIATAPGMLEPAGTVLDAMRGLNPDTDLTRTVTGLNTTAAVLTRTPGQLGEIVDSLAGTSKVLADNSDPLARTIATLPDVLRTSREGAIKIAPALDKVTAVAADLRPAVQELDPLLEELQPTLAELRPVLDDLRPLLEDAQPLVEQLVPTVEQGIGVIQDVRGPVLDRVNGPIADTLLAEWQGNDPKYPNGGRTGNLFYQELGSMFANINNGVSYSNKTAHLLGFQAGAGTTSITGTGDAAQDLQNQLSRLYGPPHQSPPLQLPPADGIQLPDLGEGSGP